MRDIAAAAGVTYQAVSLALSGRPGVSGARRRQIRDLADSMGYYPRAAARMLSQRRTGQIGLISARAPKGLSVSSQRFVDSFISACESGGRHYHIEFRHHSQDLIDGVFKPPHSLAGGLVDGVILAEDVGDALRDWLVQRGIPFVSINEPAQYSVMADESGGMRLAMEHLIALGHRRIAATFGPQRYSVHRTKRETFFEIVKERGLDLPDD
jgi:DNA-binding LacI/PurR family transcriptional regulator